MKAKTMDGRDVALDPDILADLRMRVKGPVLTPNDVGYDQSRTVWNRMIHRKPAIVVRCLGTADVIASVRFAREKNLLL
jgi:hypothetical protein